MGDFIHHIDNLVSKLDRNDPAPTYCSGIQVLNPAKVNQLIEPVEDFGDLWSQLIQKRQLFSSSVLPDKWFTVDTLEQLTQMNNQKA
ncbi:hypothetical protein [Algoriphagus boritolerans]|uniref:hypothetical protein n=1 Tax=Algoriphagus boritolerans TaxID=308111 RepID=UPI002FCE28CE